MNSHGTTEQSRITDGAVTAEGALKQLKDPWLHRLVYEILKVWTTIQVLICILGYSHIMNLVSQFFLLQVPQIEERLECMLFQTAFEDFLWDWHITQC